MSDKTNNPAAETNDDIVRIPDYQFGTQRITLVSTKPRSKKNSAEKVSYFYPELTSWSDVSTFLLGTIDREKVAAAIMRELIKPAFSEATAAAREVNPETGELELNGEKLLSVFEDQFNPASRRASGESKKELQERIANLTPELMQLITRQQEDPSDEANKNRLAQLLLEINELNQKIEAKTRKPAAKKKA